MIDAATHTRAERDTRKQKTENNANLNGEEKTILRLVYRLPI